MIFRQMAGLMANLKGITKQKAIPYFVLNILQFFITFQSLFQPPYYLYMQGEKNNIKPPTLDFLPSTYYIYNEGNKSQK